MMPFDIFDLTKILFGLYALRGYTYHFGMSKLAEVIYRQLPPALRHIAASFQGWKNNRLRRGGHFRPVFATLCHNDQLSPEELEGVQLQMLKRLLAEVVDYSPYYQAIFATAGVDHAKIASAHSAQELLQALPLLEKEILKREMPRIVSRNPARKTCAETMTSGTTGMPMVVAVDEESVQIPFATWAKFYKWMGLPETFRCARLSGRILVEPGRARPPFWVHNYPARQLFMSTYHLKDEFMPSYIDQLNRFKPELIDGYPSALYILAHYMNVRGLKLDFVPIAAASTAETLYEHQRHEIETAFGCKLFNQYASSEGAPWIVECSHGGLHMWIDTGVFEFIDAQKLEDGREISELVVTSFRSLKTPLIRYRIGDYIVRHTTPQTCPCGSHYPIISEILGRQDDILYTRQKGYVGRLDTAYKGVTGIRQSKVIQTSLEDIDVLVVPECDYTEASGDLLLANLRDRLGNVHFALKLVEEIPLGKNGKLKAVERRFKLDL